MLKKRERVKWKKGEKIVPVHTMKAYRGSRHYRKVHGQLCVSATLPPGKNTWYPLNGRLGVPQSQFRQFGTEKVKSVWGRSILDEGDFKPVTFSLEISWQQGPCKSRNFNHLLVQRMKWQWFLAQPQKHLFSASYICFGVSDFKLQYIMRHKWLS